MAGRLIAKKQYALERKTQTLARVNSVYLVLGLAITRPNDHPTATLAVVLLHHTKREEACVNDERCSNEVSVDRVPVRASASLDLQQNPMRFVHSIDGVTNSGYALLTKEHRQRDPIRDPSSGLDPIAQPLKPRSQNREHAIAAKPTHCRGVDARLSLGYLCYQIWDPCGWRIALRVVSPLRIATHMDHFTPVRLMISIPTGP